MHSLLTTGASAVLILHSCLLLAGRADAQTRNPAVATILAPGAEPTSTLVRTYCLGCHSTRQKAGGLDLESVAGVAPSIHADTWEKVIRKLRVGAMPPQGARRPGTKEAAAVVTALEQTLDAAARRSPEPGRPAVHRLNRTEYANAIRDLLAVDVDARTLLPADDTGFGFDNIGDVLTVSPALLDRYLMAARTISRLALGDPSLEATVAVYSLPYLTLLQDERTSEALPLGSRGGAAVRHVFPLDGEYEIRLRLQRNALDLGAEIRGLDVATQIDVRLDGQRAGTFTIGGAGYGNLPYGGGDDKRDAGLTLRLPVKAGTRVIGVSFPGQRWDVEGVGMSRLPPASHAYAAGLSTDQTFGRILMGLDRVEVAGPFNGQRPADTPSRRRLFACAPRTPAEELPCARRVIAKVGRLAFRRPFTPKDMDRVLPFYVSAQRTGGFDAGVQAALERILVSPSFLVRQETTPREAASGAVHRVSEIDLASRLSFFLWSSAPDDELLQAAEQGRLSAPDVMAQQVRRMLADERSSALVSNFFGQWLLLRNLRDMQKDYKLFPYFDENLREAMQEETRLFLESQVREDRPVPELLTARYTFVNERLARHYGMRGVYGSHFRRVTHEDPRRSGLLGHASVLTVTSYADRTSVVLRGKWILENVLGTPPPPPPANVPPLPSGAVTGTLRQRMKQHRRNPVCATCHAQIDPLGFAFENFDGVGRWREQDGGEQVDASGAFSDGTPFTGPTDFHAAVSRYQDAFTVTLTEKLLTYALGRGVEAFDMPAVREIIRTAGTQGHRWSSLIVAVARSIPFQMRRADS